MYYPACEPTSVSAPVIERKPLTVSNGATGSQTGEAYLYLGELKDRLAIDLNAADYDAALTRLLATAIGSVESYTRLSLQPQRIVVRYSAYDGGPVPFGPVWATEPSPVVTGVTDGSTVTINNSTADALTGGDFPFVSGNFSAGTVSYNAGYSHDQEGDRPVPDELVGAILEHAATSFREGGVSGGNPGTYWKALAGPRRRFD